MAQTQLIKEFAPSGAGHVMDLSMAPSEPACVYFLVHLFVCLSLFKHSSATRVCVCVCVSVCARKASLYGSQPEFCTRVCQAVLEWASPPGWFKY